MVGTTDGGGGLQGGDGAQFDNRWAKDRAGELGLELISGGAGGRVAGGGARAGEGGGRRGSRKKLPVMKPT